eukprot:276288_1
MMALKFKAFKYVFLFSVAFVIYNIIYLHNHLTSYNKISEENNYQQKSLLTLIDSNCSIAWRNKHPIYTNITDIYHLLSQNAIKYQFDKIPKGTFTYWLAHIDSTHQILNKSFFANKYRVKQYISNYTKLYPQFKWLNYAQILYNFGETINETDAFPSYDKITQLKQQYGGFLVKPNHMSGKQLVFTTNRNISMRRYNHIIGRAKQWLRLKYRTISNGINREKWYEFIAPHVFIEEHLNVNASKGYVLTEYKFGVFNGKALFVYVIGYKTDPLNIYVLPEYKLLNVSWAQPPNKNWNYKIPSPKNLNRMINFAQHFANRERINFVRVDLYEINDKIYFSEFTFSPNAAINVIKPLSFDYLLYDILCDNHPNDIARMRHYLL